MVTLQLNVPEAIIDELRQRAIKNHRAMEEVATSILIDAVTLDQQRGDLTAEQLIERARQVREGHPNAWVTEEFLRMAKNDGRE